MLQFIPLVGPLMDLFSSQPELASAGSGASLILVETLLRKVPSKKRMSIFLGAQKVLTLGKALLGLLETVLKLIDQKLDHLLKQKLKE